jgi:hypothetical protein
LVVQGEHDQELDEDEDGDDKDGSSDPYERSGGSNKYPSRIWSAPSSSVSHRKKQTAFQETSKYPTSVSIDALLNAGKLVKPKPKTKATLTLEKFDIRLQEWVENGTMEVLIEDEPFSAGGFRKAFKAISTQKDDGKSWVIKTYKEKAIDTIENTLSMTIESHTRKQVQLHCAAREMTKRFTSKVPFTFGKSFTYNRAFYTIFKNKPATVEEFIPGRFVKYVNNDGRCISPPSESDPDIEDLFEKA